MEQTTAALYVTIGLLIAIVAGLVFWMIRRSRRADAQREATARQHHDETESLRATQAQALADARTQHLSAVAASRRDHDRQQASLRAEIDAHEKLQAAAVFAAARGLKWELASRQQLVTACEQAGLDAVIATNIVFAPNEAGADPFCAQIDHLVVTDNVVLLVENKRWAGMVFDGIHPSTKLPGLATVLNDSDLRPPFAVQISRTSRRSLKIRFAENDDSPAQQARQQALRLREFLRATMAPPLVDTCIFYSHPQAHVVTGGSYTERSMTTVMATPQDLPAVLTAAHTRRPGRLGADAAADVIEAVRALGADLVGVGRFEVDYVSPVRLEYRIPAK